MRQSSHGPRMLAPAVVGVLGMLGVACGGGSGGGSSDAPTAVDDAGSEVAQIAGVGVEDRCDLSFNTARFNETTQLAHHTSDGHEPGDEVDFTLQDWAEVFVDERLGLTVERVVDELQTQDVYRRHVLGGVLTHTLEPDPWVPMTDRSECEALAGELRDARAAAARYPTVGDALADGYTLGDSYVAGLGVHYQNFGYLGAFDPGQPAQLLYDGTEDDATLVGLSYVVPAPGDVPPEGFTGDNDRWHRHRSFCLDHANGGVNLASDVLSPAECAALGGSHTPNPDWWMLHVWVAPGCESDWGMFSAANTRLPYLPEGAELGSGCDSGKTISDSLDLDERGSGPGII